MGSFEVSRSTTIAAPPEALHRLIDDFHEWTMWSPWEDVDPHLQRTYSGADAGVGARYAWKGNRKAGEGSMEISESTPGKIDIDLHFVKPFENDTTTVFELTPKGSGTEVTWRMKGETKGLWSVVSKVFPMDRMVGKDFEKGLTRLKSAAEHPTA